MPASNVTPLRRPLAPPQPRWQDVLHDVAGKHTDATTAFDRLEDAFAHAHESGDAICQMALSAHAMAFMVADWSRFNGWKTWVERFERAELEIPDADHDEASLLACATGAMARALLVGEPLKSMAPLGEHLQSKIGKAATAQQATHMALASAVLLPLFQMTRAVSDAQVLHAQMTDIWSSWRNANDATELLSLLGLVSWAQHWHYANPSRLPEIFAQLDAAINAAPSEILKCGVTFRHARVIADNALHRKDDEAVQQALHAMLAALHADRPMERVIYNAQAAIVASSRNDPDGAMRHIEHMNRALLAADCPPSISAIYRAREGAIYLGVERYALAVAAFETATSNVPDSQSTVPIGYISLTRALESLQQRDHFASISPECAARLRDGLAAVRKTSTHGFFFSAPKARGAVCAIALRENIEPEFIRESLKLVPTPPPAWADDHWPWAMSVRSFGGFRLQTKLAEGQRADKASSRPLLLLKLISAHGEKGIPVSTAMDALWQEQDGDQAEHALTVTLQRLRKLFVEEDLILRNDGWLTLNAEKVWTDVRALEQHLEAMSTALIERTDSRATDETQLLHCVRRLFDLYRGDCLLGVDETWADERAAYYRAQITSILRLYASYANRARHLILSEMCSAKIDSM
jgi:hypothetical protein